MAQILAPVLAAGTSVAPIAAPVAVAAGTVAAVAAISAKASKAQAQVTGPVLVLLQNGETTAPETTVLRNAGYTVTQATPSTWVSMSTSAFEQYAALVIGDPSASGTCSTLTPTTGTSGSDAIGTNWQAAVSGNVAVIGTAPALPGTSGANTLIADAVNYAAAGYSSSTGTGLYVSLNCEYSTASAGTSVPFLSGVENIGTDGGLTVQGGLSCSDSGTLNTWEAISAGTFGGFTSASLASGSSGSWPSPACPVKEAFNTWPTIFTPAGYDSASDASANYTASDGTSGQPYILLGAQASAGTQALAPSNGGEVPGGAADGGASNPATPGLTQANTGDPVDTENGDFTAANTDLSIPTYGPALTFSRSYDADIAQQQVKAGAPGPMGYGWTDNWASSVTTTQPQAGDIYTIGGLGTNNGNGGPGPQSVVSGPQGIEVDGSGNTYFTDTADNRVQEIPASSGSQWGISMTAGDIYTVAGSPGGQAGASTTGTPATSSQLDAPEGVAVTASGLYIADTGNCRVIEIAASTGTQYGISMTAGDMYVIAGRTGQCAVGDDAKVATQSDLDYPVSLHVGAAGHAGDLYIADTGNNRIQEIAGANETEWGQSMTNGYAYTVAGSSAGTSGQSNSGTKATTAFLAAPDGITIDGSGNMYVADTDNCRVEQVPWSGGTYWGQSMTQYYLYVVAGRNSSSCTIGFDGKAATGSNLWSPTSVRDPNGNLYITDSGNNRVQEVAGTTHTEFGQSMTADFVYTVAGNASGTGGDSGDGGPATSALLNDPGSLWVDSSGDLYICDTDNNEVREVSASTFNISDLAGGNGKTLATVGDGGPAVSSGLASPRGIASDAHGDIFIADTSNNRVQEIADYSHTQFGIAMTAGDIYTVAGSAAGTGGDGGNGGLATSALLSGPEGIAVDSSGDLYIADTNNHQIREVSASTGDISAIAGNGTSGDSGNGGSATSAELNVPAAVAVDATGDIFIADPGNDEVQEVSATGGTHYGISMTIGDIYKIDGTPGTSGDSGDGGPATSAQLYQPSGVAVDAAGDIYISDTGNNRIQEVAAATHVQWDISMTAGDVYTIAGSATGSGGSTGNLGPATQALLSHPVQVVTDNAGDLYVDDTGNDSVREIAAANGTQWSQAMTVGDIYNVAGTPGTAGNAGAGGPAGAAQLDGESGIGTDPAGDLFISSAGDDLVQEVTATADSAIPAAPGQTSSLSPAPGGITVNQPGGAQVTFYAQIAGTCASPYQVAGGYCALPVFSGASLTDNTGNDTYTFTPSAGTGTYVYSWDGQLISESDSAGDTLTITYQSPAPGSGDCPSTATSCETITSASGRALVIGSNSSGLVTSVTDPMRRSWTYGYNSASQLTSATDPMTNETSYTYGSGSTGNPLLASDLLTVTSPNAQPGGPDAGDATVNVYNAAGEVTSQTDPMGFKTTLNYCVNAATGDCMNASTGTGYITVTDPDGNATVDYYVQGALGAQSVWTGTSLTSESDYIPDTSAGGTSGGTLLDGASADGDGNVTTDTYNPAGDLVSSTAPSGVGSQTGTTTSAYTSLNEGSCNGTVQATSPCSTSETGPAPVAPGGVITPPSSAPPEGVTYTLYDTDGNELYATTGVYEPGSTTASYSQTTYQLFKNNSVTLSGTNITCTYSPSSASLPCATINADGVVTQLEYDSAGDLELSSTPDGNSGGQLATTSYTYNADGEQLTKVAPDGNLTGANAGNYTTTTAYNADAEQTSVTQGNGSGYTDIPRSTGYFYDADGNQTKVTDARGYSTVTAYTADNKPVLVTNPDGDAMLTCYDGDGHAAQTVPPVGVAASNLTAASCPTAYPAGYTDRLAADATASTFNAMGDVTSQTTPAPAGQSGYETTSYTYDRNGNLLTTTAPPTSNANGAPDQVTVSTYNAASELASQTVGYGTSAAATASYCYDPDGDKTSVVDADGNVSGTAACETSSPWVVPSSAPQAAYQNAYAYDSAGELVSTVTPANTASGTPTTTVTYDPAGNTLTRTDPDGVITTWTYTPLNLPATISYSGSSAHSVGYSYDAGGNETGMTDATGTSAYVYDSFGELTSAKNGAGQTTGYTYNADGQVSSITYPLPEAATWATTDTVSYGYDNADELTSVTDFNGHQIGITNTADGRPTSEALGSSGDSVGVSYDGNDNPSAIALKNSSSTLQSFTYSDAPSGNILSETDTPTSSQSPAIYTYDSQGRVTSDTPGTGSAKDYGFDASGSLTTLPNGATGSYNDAEELNSQTLSGTATNYTYNADGEQLSSTQGSATESSATWNGAGQLATYDNSAADMSAASYDGNGMRASSTITPSGQSAVTQGYVWDTVAPVAELLMDGTNAYVYDGGLAPAEQVNLSSGTVTYLVTDALGSVRGTVSSGGALTGTVTYDAWGNPLTAGGLSATTPFGYAGGYADPDGLIYLLNRYYQPSSGQFISVDPAIAQTQQPYEYASGDPVLNSDPTGKFINARFWCTSGFWVEFCVGYMEESAVENMIAHLHRLATVGEACSRITDFFSGSVADILGQVCDLFAQNADWFADAVEEYWHTCREVFGENVALAVWAGRTRYWWLVWRWAWFPVVPLSCLPY
ncbi:MAG TPA: RHS repeat-associated core domain-containing protein [Streptosporangiaceae bacterium]|nr:RHS repeat-associated core domain-containing protein [Streptosporangiaceae bacterium]